jgi:hypothetical protein
MRNQEGLCRCFRRDQHLVGGGLKTGSNGPFVTKCGQCRSQRDKPFRTNHFPGFLDYAFAAYLSEASNFAVNV